MRRKKAQAGRMPCAYSFNCILHKPNSGYRTMAIEETEKTIVCIRNNLQNIAAAKYPMRNVIFIMLTVLMVIFRNNQKILDDLSLSPPHLRRNWHIQIAFHKFRLGPCPTHLADLTPTLFRDLSYHSLRHGMDVQLPSCQTVFYHISFSEKA